MKVTLMGPDDLGYWFLDDENGNSFPSVERHEDHPQAAANCSAGRPRKGSRTKRRSSRMPSIG